MPKADMPKVYEHEPVEGKWAKIWVEKQYYRADVNSDKPPFVMVLPPPNITGFLHMGHALNFTIQDILARYKRMRGYNVLWLPGIDHAGIATQNVVERELAKQGLSREDLGREKFIEKVWEWKEHSGGTILKQARLLGASCDWTRLRFTMDEKYRKAVRKAFYELWRQGLIARDDYIVNWCPRCGTALSDIEVEHEEIDGKLWFVKYRLEGGGFITIATTRPETILGDTAIAVNPSDERYKHLIGKHAYVPIVERRVPIIADELVDPEFGTGALKVTPGHDAMDFEIGKKHGIPAIKVIDEKGRMTEEAGPFKGMDRFEAREAVVRELERRGQIEKVVDYKVPVGRCYRCKTIIEPLVSKQWFVRMKPLAGPAISAVKNGFIKFVPERWKKVYYQWMENIKDWCISRQIWWGHRIPVWYCQDCGHENVVEEGEPEACEKCGSKNLVQDESVLDTWFSSALWPFATLGWPEKTCDLEKFYPTSVLVTGFDIIFFWVARMIMTGIHFMGEKPFLTVYYHGLVRDERGKKMSKSFGNVIDPLDVVKKYGADALRFTLAVLITSQGQDIKLSEEKIRSMRNFTNKVWNASRFVIMNLGGFEPPKEGEEKLYNYTLADRWILSRYNKVVKEVTDRLENFDFGNAAQTLYDFFWGEFCDWYIELTKPRLYGRGTELDRRTAQYVLWRVLRGLLQLMHPFMPFITEEIWHYLPRATETISLTEWPDYSEGEVDEDAERKMELIMEIIRQIRSVKSLLNVPVKVKPKVVVAAKDREARLTVEAHTLYISELARVESVETKAELLERPEGSAMVPAKGTEVYVLLKGLIDLEKERKRLETKLKDIEEEISKVEKRLGNGEFLRKAKPEVVEKFKRIYEELKRDRERVSQALSYIGK